MPSIIVRSASWRRGLVFLTKRCTLNAVHFKISSSQKGFSALPIFLVGLVVLIILSSSGFFNYEKSIVTDTTRYKAVEKDTLSKKGSLHLKTLEFEAHTVPTTTVPSPTIEVVPTPRGNFCPHYSEPLDCDCDPLLPKILFCNGNLPPSATGVCEDSPACREIAATNSTCKFYCLGKPVIYLYPEKPMLVDVEVGTHGKVVVSDPQIETLSYFNGWRGVMAHPNGILIYKGQPYRELFYETESTTLARPKKGVVMLTKNIETELLNFIKQLGLSRKDEQDEFMEWWIPRLENLKTEKLFVSILEKDEKARLDQVIISPKPDTFIEFIVYFAPLGDHTTVVPLVLPKPPERKGFTAIEWGGVIVR